MTGALTVMGVLAVAILGEAILSRKTIYVRNQNGEASTEIETLPMNSLEMEKVGWVKRPLSSNVPSSSNQYMYLNKTDPTVAVIVDSEGNPTGYQFCVDPKKISGNITALEDFGYYLYSNTANYITTNYLCAYVKYDDKAAVMRYKGPDGREKTISTVDVGTNTYFTEQNCIAERGTYWFYKMTSETSCTADSFPYVFLMTKENGDVHGFGIWLIGKKTVDSGMKNWFANEDESTVKAALKNAPSCLYEYASNPGICGVEVFFTDPSTITC